MAGTKRDASFSQKELSIERHQKNALLSKLSALESKVMQQRKEIREVEGDATSRLTDAGSHVRQTRHEVANLKAKVRFHV